LCKVICVTATSQRVCPRWGLDLHEEEEAAAAAGGGGGGGAEEEEVNDKTRKEEEFICGLKNSRSAFGRAGGCLAPVLRACSPVGIPLTIAVCSGSLCRPLSLAGAALESMLGASSSNGGSAGAGCQEQTCPFCCTNGSGARPRGTRHAEHWKAKAREGRQRRAETPRPSAPVAGGACPRFWQLQAWRTRAAWPRWPSHDVRWPHPSHVSPQCFAHVSPQCFAHVSPQCFVISSPPPSSGRPSAASKRAAPWAGEVRPGRAAALSREPRHHCAVRAALGV
jgi:hypothetical protein